MADKITARPFRRNVNDFKALLDVMNIKSIKDIPSREDLVAKIAAGNHTARDVWFAKMYQSGLNLKIANKIRLGKYDVSENVKTILYHMQGAFPEVKGNKETPAGIVSTVKKHQNKINNYFTQKFIDVETPLRDMKGTNYKTLTNVVKNTLTEGLPVRSKKVKNIFAPIENMKNYDGIMKKIFEGIREIPDRSLREFVLINLLGTRGDQNLEMVADRGLAQELSPPRAFYDREVGNIAGSIVEEGKKQLPENVPLGPFLRDMMDRRWDNITNFGEIAEDVGMWDDLPENINLGSIVNTYIFKITKDNPRGIFTAKEIGLLNRPDKPIPNGFTDLRRLTMAWNARKTGKRALADELLGHGKSEISEGSEMISAVGSQYYLPGTPTPIDNLRAFNTAMEQNIAKLLGYKNYTELNSKWNILGADESGVVGNYINAVPEFKGQTIIPPIVNGQIDVEEIIPTTVTYQPDSSEVIEARETSRLANLSKDTASANFDVYQKAMTLMNNYNKTAAGIKLTFEKAYEMVMDKSKVDKPPTVLKGQAGELQKRSKLIDAGNRLDNQTPATQGEIDKVVKETGADMNTRAGRNSIRKFFKGIGKYMPFVSFAAGLYTAKQIRKMPPEVFGEEAFTIDEGPHAGQQDMRGQVLSLFGIDTDEERQDFRVAYEKISGALPRQLSLLPPGSIIAPTIKESEAEKQHTIDVANKLAEEEVY
tara:strand:+ start:45 stop:2168 length:2124 start_codon:yes stop_codon:yes gene_type:complete